MYVNNPLMEGLALDADYVEQRFLHSRWVRAGARVILAKVQGTSPDVGEFPVSELRPRSEGVGRGGLSRYRTPPAPFSDRGYSSILAPL